MVVFFLRLPSPMLVHWAHRVVNMIIVRLEMSWSGRKVIRSSAITVDLCAAALKKSACSVQYNKLGSGEYYSARI